MWIHFFYPKYYNVCWTTPYLLFPQNRHCSTTSVFILYDHLFLKGFCVQKLGYTNHTVKCISSSYLMSEFKWSAGLNEGLNEDKCREWAICPLTSSVGPHPSSNLGLFYIKLLWTRTQRSLSQWRNLSGHWHINTFCNLFKSACVVVPPGVIITHKHTQTQRKIVPALRSWLVNSHSNHQ